MWIQLQRNSSSPQSSPRLVEWPNQFVGQSIVSSDPLCPSSNTNWSIITALLRSPKLARPSSITLKPSITASDFTPVLPTKAQSLLNLKLNQNYLNQLSVQSGQSH